MKGVATMPVMSPQEADVPTTQAPPADVLERILRENWWYHRMNLGGGRETPGRYGDNLVPVAHLLSHVDLRGMTCLDIGVMDGKMSFLMESLGGRVLAVDGVGTSGIRPLIDAFGSSVRYRTGIIVEKLPELLADEGLFDFILCSGVAYHVYSPFDLLANVRLLLRTGGMAIVETAAIPDDANPTLVLNRGDQYNDYTTIWIPSTACVRHMIRFLSMRILGESRLEHGYHVVRHAFLVQAERPSVMAREVGDPWLAKLLAGAAPGKSHAYLKPQLDLAALEARPPSMISAAPVTGTPVFHLQQPDEYRAEAELLARGTPAWRLLS